MSIRDTWTVLAKS